MAGCTLGEIVGGTGGGGGLNIGDPVGSGTAGSVLFVDASGDLGQDNANFFWDDANDRLGLGTATPGGRLEIVGAEDVVQLLVTGHSTQTSAAFRVEDDSNVDVFTVDTALHLVDINPLAATTAGTAKAFNVGGSLTAGATTNEIFFFDINPTITSGANDQEFIAVRGRLRQGTIGHTGVKQLAFAAENSGGGQFCFQVHSNARQVKMGGYVSGDLTEPDSVVQFKGISTQDVFSILDISDVDLFRMGDQGEVVSTVTLDDATGEEAAHTINLTVNKATSGDAIGIQMNVTDTASPDQIRFIEVDVDGTVKFAVEQDSAFSGATDMLIGGGGFAGQIIGSGQLFCTEDKEKARTFWDARIPLTVGVTTEILTVSTAPDIFELAQAGIGGQATADSGNQNWAVISADINQTLTAGYVGFFIDITETGTGSGTKLVTDWQVGGSSLFNMENQGQSIQNVTLDDATGSEDAHTINYTVNKATSGDATGLLISKTDTASPDDSNLIRGEIGGTTYLRIDSNAVATLNILGGSGSFAQCFVGTQDFLNGASGGAGILFREGATGSVRLRTASDSLATASGNAFEFDFRGDLTASSGTQNIFDFNGTVNQTSTAGYTGLFMDITETGTGSGTNLLVDFQIGSTSVFSIENNGITTLTGRLLMDKGADVASATAVTLGNDGNMFDITGTTTIDTIVVTGWQSGSMITLKFDSTPTVTDQAGGSGQLRLSGSANFSATANDTLVFQLDGTEWFEVSRTVI